jgi:NAD(P)-dependent dehydrogenase (short-subunit alcohol dehydrogenase family)
MNDTDYRNVHATKHAGKIVLVTGGNSGIGLATAKRFAREGAAIYVTGRRQAELDAAVHEIGRGAKAIQGDIASAADLDRIYSQIAAAEDHLDMLFANAGGGEFTPLPLVTEAKAALRSLTRTWASDLKGRDIRVNIVVPGAVVTPAYKSELKLSDAQIEQYKLRIAELAPLAPSRTTG